MSARPRSAGSTGAYEPGSGHEFVLMGVVNVTPDSFSDGGLFLDPSLAVTHGLELQSEGAGILDIGGESTRPGAAPVPVAEELERVVPVIEGLVAANVAAKLSIDTSKSAVAAAALRAGASIVNDVTALRAAPEIAGLVADSGAELCLMHMLGDPRTMQSDPRYDDVVSDVKRFLEERMAFAVSAGCGRGADPARPGDRLRQDGRAQPGAAGAVGEIVALGRPVVIGTSRKSFIGRLTGREVDERLAGTIATNVLAYERGARIFRVHDVEPLRDALHGDCCYGPLNGARGGGRVRGRRTRRG